MEYKESNCQRQKKYSFEVKVKGLNKQQSNLIFFTLMVKKKVKFRNEKSSLYNILLNQMANSGIKQVNKQQSNQLKQKVNFGREKKITIKFFLTYEKQNFLGSGPGRGRSPVEWGDFPSFRLFVRLFVRPSPPAWLGGPQTRLRGPQTRLGGPQIWLGGPQVWLGGPQTWLGGPQTWLGGHQTP